ncbi:unnamed protein product [Pneumocystis jirovecii]|uniref:Uncharacterized protein n=1 Tax=Pneumocystis jirovecii TaxID=42068 RepID=L0PGA9_PNEJI|nr:unnamed protein product [Pneumocystis jirovecii]
MITLGEETQSNDLKGVLGVSTFCTCLIPDISKESLFIESVSLFKKKLRFKVELDSFHVNLSEFASSYGTEKVSFVYAIFLINFLAFKK